MTGSRSRHLSTKRDVLLTKAPENCSLRVFSVRHAGLWHHPRCHPTQVAMKEFRHSCLSWAADLANENQSHCHRILGLVSKVPCGCLINCLLIGYRKGCCSFWQQDGGHGSRNPLRSVHQAGDRCPTTGTCKSLQLRMWVRNHHGPISLESFTEAERLKIQSILQGCSTVGQATTALAVAAPKLTIKDKKAPGYLSGTTLSACLASRLLAWWLRRP